MGEGLETMTQNELITKINELLVRLDGLEKRIAALELKVGINDQD